MNPELVEQRMASFVRRCAEAGLAATHQRYIIYRVLAESPEHPSPEMVYERVKQQIPSISPATVYKNIKTFLALGLLREVSEFHNHSRLDANLDRHHHLICLRCKKVVDFYDERLDRAAAQESSPKGFQIVRYQVEVQGLCPDCQRLTKKKEEENYHGKSGQRSRRKSGRQRRRVAQ